MRTEYRLEQQGSSPPPRRRRRRLTTALVCAACLVLAAAVGLGAGTLIRSLTGVRVVERSGPATTGRETPGYVLAEDLTGLSRQLDATEIYQLLSPSCVGVTTPLTTTNAFGQVSGSAITGSGFLVSADGYIITNYHVVQTAYDSGLTVEVMLYGGEKYPAVILGGDEENDVALLKIEGTGLQPAVMGSFESTQVGETVYAIGNPLGELTYTMTSGIVSALDRSINTETNLAISMFQIDAAINSGNSGGPVVNDRGQVIGIASAKFASSGVEGLGFAIPIDDALKVADDLAEYGFVRGRVALGITVTSAAYYGYDHDGALVLAVSPGGSGQRAGLQEGDIIIAVNGAAIPDSPTLIAAKKAWKPGDTLALTVLRENQTLEVSLTLEEKLPDTEKRWQPFAFGER